MHTMKGCSAQVGIVATSLLAGVLVLSGAPHAMEHTAAGATIAMAVPPGAPAEDVRYANEWPAPSGDLYNTRVAHATISDWWPTRPNTRPR
jgi:hypothetical protein